MAARVLVILVVGELLTGCAASSRVEDIMPSWANTTPGQATTQHQLKEGRSKPDAKPQERTEAAKPQERTAVAKPQERTTTAPQATFEE